VCSRFTHHVRAILALDLGKIKTEVSSNFNHLGSLWDAVLTGNVSARRPDRKCGQRVASRNFTGRNDTLATQSEQDQRDARYLVMRVSCRGCIGCHETHSTTPPAAAGLAFRRPPSKITPPPWGTESIGYERFVQPVLDRYCGECHQGEGEARGDLDLTLRPGWDVFKEPYLTLVGSAAWVPGGPTARDRAPLPKPDQPGYGIAAPIPVQTMATHNDPKGYATLRPMRYLSCKSRLIEMASSGEHYDVKVDPASLRRLIAWVDADSPFMGERELRALGDPEFAGIDQLPIRPRVKTAPVIERP